MSNYYRDTPLLTPGPNGKASPPAHVRPPVDDKSVDFRRVLYALRRGKWIILLTTQLITAAVAVYTYGLDPVYRAASMVSIDTWGSGAENNVSFGEKRSVSQELALLQYSVDLADRVVKRLVETADALGTKDHFPLLRSDQGNELTSRQIVAMLMHNVRFQGGNDQNIISIVVESTVPEEAATIANLYAEEYRFFGRERSRASVVAVRELLEEQVSRRRQELEDLEYQWEGLALEQQDYDALGQGAKRIVAEYEALSIRRDEVRMTLEQGLFQMELLQKQLAQIEPDLEEMILEERVVSDLTGQIDVLDRRIAELKVEAEQYYAVTPELRGNEAQVPELEEVVNLIQHFTGLKVELANHLITWVRKDTLAAVGEGHLVYVNRLRSSFTEKHIANRALKVEIDALEARLDYYEPFLQGIPRQAIQQKRLDRRLALAEQWYTSFLRQLQQTLITEESELGYVKLVRNAFVPSAPVRPNVSQNILLGFLLGIGFGVGLAFVRQAMKSTLSRPEDLTEHGYHLVGIVPRMDKVLRSSFGNERTVEVKGRLLSTSLITHLDPWSPIAENFRLIRTNIEFTEFSRPLQTLLVTSPEVADGKSVTAVNTAIAMAQAGRRTLLIDADLRRPGAHKLLDLERTPGLVEILSGRYAFHEDDFTTNIPNLWCIPAGHLDALPVELFGLENVKHFLDTLRQQFDIIILDSPPVLSVSDAVVLAPQCDATVIVVRADATDLQALEMAQKMLKNVGTFVIGIIINRFDDGKSSGYKYDYSYYRDYGYSSKPS